MIQAFLETVHSSKSGFFLQCLRAFLYLLSLVFRAGVACKNAVYDGCNNLGRGFGFRYLKVNMYHSKAQVISIGNIVAGGTGKTPLTLFIAKKILEKGKPLAILSRGYKAKIKSDTFGPQQISFGKGPVLSAQECGDEPYLISRCVPQALFFVGKNRVEAARMAVQKKARVILLDDGMQYRKLHRNVEIVTLDANDPFGKGYFLPRGFLRDHPQSLARADLIVVNHAKIEQLNEINLKIRRYSKAPIVAMRPHYLRTLSLDGLKEMELKGAKVVAFCGIAKPSYFYQLLEDQGAEVLYKASLNDHQEASSSFVDQLVEKAKQSQAQMIVCTEKDAVKLPINLKLQIPLAYVEMELKAIQGEQELERVLQEVI